MVAGEGPAAAERQSTSEDWVPWIGVAVFAVAAIAGLIAPMVMRSWAIHNFRQTGQRLPMSIDPETRDVIQTVYIREVQEVDGELQNVIIDEIPDVKDPLHGAN